MNHEPDAKRRGKVIDRRETMTMAGRRFMADKDIRRPGCDKSFVIRRKNTGAVAPWQAITPKIPLAGRANHRLWAVVTRWCAFSNRASRSPHLGAIDTAQASNTQRAERLNATMQMATWKCGKAVIKELNAVSVVIAVDPTHDDAVPFQRRD